MILLLHPLSVRIFHWTMFFAVMTLMVTGFILHDPPRWLMLPLSHIRRVHGAAGVILIVNFLCHISYYIATGKWTETLFLRKDIANIPSFLRYYLFITEGHPNYGRYNPGQKALFSVWAAGVILASVSGVALLLPDDSGLLQRIVGGLGGIRILHYLVWLLFAATIPLHLYLVFTEDPAKLQAMFTGYVRHEPTPAAKKKVPEQAGQAGGWEGKRN